MSGSPITEVEWIAKAEDVAVRINRRAHRVVNRAASPVRYLLVQAMGPYDFVEVKE